MLKCVAADFKSIVNGGGTRITPSLIAAGDATQFLLLQGIGSQQTLVLHPVAISAVLGILIQMNRACFALGTILLLAAACSSDRDRPAPAGMSSVGPAGSGGSHAGSGGEGGDAGTSGKATGGGAGTGGAAATGGEAGTAGTAATGGGAGTAGAGATGGSSGSSGNPAWAPTSTTGAPARRRSHQSVWTGNQMIVFGGSVYDGAAPRLGGLYSPASDSWSGLPEQDAPCFVPSTQYVYAATGVWTGTELILWCGQGSDRGGGRYQPGGGWTLISAVGGPDGTPSAVWTGSEMIVWTSNNGTGARYNPSSDLWTSMSPHTGLSLSETASVVWTGTEMIVWGGGLTSGYSNAGARYNPSTDSWTAISSSGAPSARSLHSALWTGTEMIVWGGWAGQEPRLGDGGRYNPTTDTWQPIAAVSEISGRDRHTAVWTGSQMIVWGGAHGPPYPTDKGLYSPASGTWSVIHHEDYRFEHSAVWTGSRMIVWGGVAIAESDVFNTGGVFTP
jgi:hypothetical protein